MAKSKANRPTAEPKRPARAPGLHSVRLDLTDELYDWLRVRAARHRLPMSRMARQVMEETKKREETVDLKS
jgi:hypothetical protein